MKKRTYIYLLQDYANQNNMKEIRSAREQELRVVFSENGLNIELSETNSLIEEQYSLNLKSAKYVLEGITCENVIKEAMIHHHPHGHTWKHLQFTLRPKHKVIRIILDPVDEEDYQNCIKGFLHLCQDIMIQEMEENKIKVNLPEYFFNEKIKELIHYRSFLLDKVRRAYESGSMLNDSNHSIDEFALSELKKEKHLLPFLNWRI